jgi:hypothetical protein
VIRAVYASYLDFESQLRYLDHHFCIWVERSGVAARLANAVTEGQIPEIDLATLERLKPAAMKELELLAAIAIGLRLIPFHEANRAAEGPSFGLGAASFCRVT